MEEYFSDGATLLAHADSASHPKVRWIVIEHFLHQILSGNIKTGEALPHVNDICERLQVSRTAVREAVGFLSAKGLLTAKAGSGTRVRPLAEWSLLDTEVISWLRDSRMSVELLEHMLEVRMILEPEAAALASVRATTEQIRAIEDALKEMETGETHRGPESTQGDIDFHTRILDASGNIILARMRALIGMSIELSVRLTFTRVPSIKESLDGHRNILDAIRSRNPEKARSAAARVVYFAVRDLRELNIPVRPDSLYILTKGDTKG
ncbi:FadR/GntR family transcriptional regulator [Desulfoluna spongiiphila]|uniref:DNA-binding transcriptional regulator, FadR family n=1 Tax=Desulfoluna spongiiphila TaxID=419481 RepID=A0A1G5I988_9BACT|nr:FadR/GntR family transcriptional regulator [Desulfoluna spongiiphila]SCY72613.1 DNA-binding transcriptional regulator, FadR family [Desulfoluna spongiiphila]VVS93180.1 transcription regulator hth gntr [Desulfoluna spongiiphila]